METDSIIAHFTDVKRQKPGDWMAKCPAHEDKQASLHITSKSNGDTLLKCFAGCPTPSIVAAAGLTMPDLFSKPLPPREKSPAKKPEIVARYSYVDEDGVLLYQSIRTNPKSFWFRRPSETSGWINSLGDVRRVPYRLPHVLEAVRDRKPVWVVEGEKDANALAEWFCSTCCAGGADSWKDFFADHFRGAIVNIIPDNDDAGEKYAQSVARSLSGVAARISIVRLPDLPKGGDFSDWKQAGGTRPQLITLEKTAPEWQESCKPVYNFGFERTETGFSTKLSADNIISEIKVLRAKSRSEHCNAMFNIGDMFNAIPKSSRKVAMERHFPCVEERYEIARYGKVASRVRPADRDFSLTWKFYEEVATNAFSDEEIRSHIQNRTSIHELRNLKFQAQKTLRMRISPSLVSDRLSGLPEPQKTEITAMVWNLINSQFPIPDLPEDCE